MPDEKTVELFPSKYKPVYEFNNSKIMSMYILLIRIPLSLVGLKIKGSLANAR